MKRHNKLLLVSVAAFSSTALAANKAPFGSRGKALFEVLEAP